MKKCNICESECSWSICSLCAENLLFDLIEKLKDYNHYELCDNEKLIESFKRIIYT
jgi:hypothetical protein